MDNILLAAILITVVGGGAALLYRSYRDSVKKHNEDIAKLRMDYKDAIKGGDRQKALNAGRLYYQSVRGGALTIYDEQAIANDLSAIK